MLACSSTLLHVSTPGCSKPNQLTTHLRVNYTPPPQVRIVYAQIRIANTVTKWNQIMCGYKGSVLKRALS